MRRDLTNILVPLVYFIQGASSIGGVAATFYFKEDLGFTVLQLQTILSVYIIPWSIKPLYGLLSDRQPIWGLRRKPYLFLSGLLAAAGYLSLATWVQSFAAAFACVFVAGMGFALSDVIVDGIVAEQSRSQKVAGKLQSICRASLLIGGLLMAYLSGKLTELIGARNVFFITGSLPLCTSLFAIIIKEIPMDTIIFSFRETWKKFKDALSPALLWSAAFLFVWRSTPSSGGAFNYFLIDELGFSPEFFGWLYFASHAMGIVGVLVFRKFLLSIPLRKLFFWIIIASVILSLPSMGLIYGWYKFLGVSPHFFAMADTLISAPLSEIGYLPLMVLVARLCPKGIEATMFAALASLMNIGLAVSDMGGGWLATAFDVRQATDLLAANYTHLDKVLWVAIFSSFLPMPFIWKLPDIRATGEGVSGTDPSGKKPIAEPIEVGKGGIV